MDKGVGERTAWPNEVPLLERHQKRMWPTTLWRRRVWVIRMPCTQHFGVLGVTTLGSEIGLEIGRHVACRPPPAQDFANPSAC